MNGELVALATLGAVCIVSVLSQIRLGAMLRAAWRREAEWKRIAEQNLATSESLVRSCHKYDAVVEDYKRIIASLRGQV